MKKIILVSTLLLSGFLFQSANAQLRVGLNINIATQPVWGPVGYDHVDYYYMPDVDMFYSVPKRQYIYQQKGKWIFSSALPQMYRSYDLYSGYKVVINEPTPYYRADNYRTKYRSYKNNHSQIVIRNSHDSRYFENKNHPQHSKWKGNSNQRNNGNQGNSGKGGSKGKGKNH